MGIMGSAFGRALGGFGAGVASLSNKYIDEEIAKQRAQAMADIQVATAGKIRQADAEFSDKRAPIERERKHDDALAAGATAREVELAALNDTTLQGTRQQVQGKNNEFARGEKVKDITATSPAEAEAAAAKVRATGKAEGDVTKQFGNDPLYIAAQRKLAAAKHIESADSVARAELVRMEIGDRKRLGGLYDELARLDGDTTMPEKDKAAKVRTVTSQIMAIRGKNGQGGGGKDPELDTQTVVEKSIGADGKETTTTRKEVRRPGQGGGSGQDPLLADMEAARKRSGAATKAPAAPAAPPSRGDQLRAQYRQELDALEQMKSGTQTPTRNRRMVPEQEQLLRDLLQQINSL